MKLTEEQVFIIREASPKAHAIARRATEDAIREGSAHLARLYAKWLVKISRAQNAIYDIPFPEDGGSN